MSALQWPLVHAAVRASTLCVHAQRESTRKSDADIENAFLDVEREMLEKLIKSGSTSRYQPPALRQALRPGLMLGYLASTGAAHMHWQIRLAACCRDSDSFPRSVQDKLNLQPPDQTTSSTQQSSQAPKASRPPPDQAAPREQRPWAAPEAQPRQVPQEADSQNSQSPPWWPAGELAWRAELEDPSQQSISSTVQRVSAAQLGANGSLTGAGRAHHSAKARRVLVPGLSVHVIETHVQAVGTLTYVAQAA